MKISQLHFLVFFLLTALFLGAQDRRSPLDVARVVADKIIAETSFKLIPAPAEPVENLEIINFGSFPVAGEGRMYALAFIKSSLDTTVSLGMSWLNGINIYLNGRQIAQCSDRADLEFKEIAYEKYKFDQLIKIELNAGRNPILFETRGSQNKIILQIIGENGYADSRFIVESYIPDKSNSTKWLFCGPFSDAAIELPTASLKSWYSDSGKINRWTAPSLTQITELKIESSSTYQRDSYLDWHYANGATMFGLIALARYLDNKRYYEFADRFCEFAVEHHDLFKDQYENHLALRGNFHKRMRLSMLDDSGGPVLPFLDLYLEFGDNNILNYIKPVMDYVRNGQLRLKDGTFCRPEPTEMTLWADDQFMSVPALLRMAEITGKEEYADDAAQQILNFAEYLLDEQTGLYYHGWFQQTESTNKIYWGRANGWTAWAASEALRWLPENHPAFQKILAIHKKHLAGLKNVQGKNGMWYQILDNPDTYEETSCSAMFIIAMARGVKEGWLDNNEYRPLIIKAWNTLNNMIDDDGTVHGICRGTEISCIPEYYERRPQVDNDPRGLGSVLIAAVEMADILK